jgi:A/G-specific adenine glycosylase
LSEELLVWFARHKRELPWRRSADPYLVWISEIMLQQTQVDRVIPYFERFVERFPTVGDLAAASVDEVLARWSGLGYYRRARFLHAAARQIVADGDFPGTFDGWKELPGIGPYTAAAIASIAFGEKVATIDGNVERVLSRFRAVEHDIKKARGRRVLEEIAEPLLDDNRPGDSNQALMELGATVCRPHTPECSVCPLASECVALAEGTVERFPVRSGSRKARSERHLGIVVEEEGKILLFRRPDDAPLLGGLWEIPWIPWSDRKNASVALSSRYGGSWHLEGSHGWVRHSITFRDIRLEVWRGRLVAASEIAEGAEAGWFEPAEMGGLALSSLVDKILERSVGGQT